MAAEKPKFSISTSDIESVQVNEVVEHLQRAKDIPLVREIGEDKSSRDGLITIVVLLLSGLVSGVVTWAVWNVLPKTDDTFTSNMQASFGLAFSVAVVLVLGDSALNRSLSKLGISLLWALPTALVGALLMGLAANALYSSLVESTWNSILASGLDPFTDSEAFAAAFTSKNHLNRGFAWAILGIAAGAAVGITSKSVKRVGITAAGGLAGGFLGGFLFDFFQGETEAQITGLAVTGGAIGLAVSLLEQVTKSSWIEILQGGMAGKQFILYQSTITIGASPNANVTLIKDPAIPALAAQIRRAGSTVTIQALDRNVPITVNSVSGFEHKLVEGSVIILGSTHIRFREKSKKVNDSAILRR